MSFRWYNEKGKPRLRVLFDCFLVLAGIALVLFFFFFEDKTSLLAFSNLVNSFLGIKWIYITGLALLVVVSIFIVVFFLLFFISVFLRKVGVKPALLNLILKKTLGFFTSGLSQENLWSWLSRGLREFSLVIYALFPAAVLMCFFNATYLSDLEAGSSVVLLFFWAAGYILIRGLYGLGLVQAFEKRLSKQRSKK